MTDCAELIYISQPIENLQAADLKTILETSRKNNVQKGITGVLCFDGHRFLQIIEGPQSHIVSLYEAIKNDTRHAQVELIHFDNIKERTFTQWIMALKSANKSLIVMLSDHSSVLNFSEVQAALQDKSYSFSAGLFSMIMDSVYNGAHHT